MSGGGASSTGTGAGGDDPEQLSADNEELAARLSALTRAALKPWDEDDAAPDDFADGWVDLLQVACDYLGLRPTTTDVSGPVPGAAVKL